MSQWYRATDISHCTSGAEEIHEIVHELVASLHKESPNGPGAITHDDAETDHCRAVDDHGDEGTETGLPVARLALLARERATTKTATTRAKKGVARPTEQRAWDGQGREPRVDAVQRLVDTLRGAVVGVGGLAGGILLVEQGRVRLLGGVRLLLLLLLLGLRVEEGDMVSESVFYCDRGGIVYLTTRRIAHLLLGRAAVAVAAASAVVARHCLRLSLCGLGGCDG